MHRDMHYVRATGLSPDQTRSLAAALAASAIDAESDPAQSTLLVPRSRNRMFDLTRIETVIQEWLEADVRRNASLAHITLHEHGRGALGRDALSFIDLNRPLRTSR
jgi:hypothetical protein